MREAIRKLLITVIVWPLLTLAAGPVLFHEHGFGFSFTPDGTVLLAPSHEGLAVFHDGEWEEAPGVARGFSGFSITERAIYSSGHSTPGAAGSPPAGLLRSEDNGRTWATLALAGEADFHLLAAGYASGAIYVFNTSPNSAMPSAGLYVTSDEGRTWRRSATRGLEGEIHGLAAHPRDAATVAAATARGLYLSRDSGETFRRLGRRSPAGAVTFASDGRLLSARVLSDELTETRPDGRSRRAMRLPRVPLDYVTSIAVNPANALMLAIASHRRDAYLTLDGGRTWQRIADQGTARRHWTDTNDR